MRLSILAPLLTFVLASAPALSEEPPLILRRAEIFGRAPDVDAPNVRVWTLRNNGVGRTNLVEMLGCLPLHRHPDADHSLLVLQGRVEVKAGGVKTVLSEGDYITIPPNVPHGYRVIGDRALLISADAPFYRKTEPLSQDCGFLDEP
ncbi:MAG: cupin domain-containing protein [Elusimicrobia bacterium]|nr:cupin domain-containing protein [Elusimicrobiota bacterium]